MSHVFQRCSTSVIKWLSASQNWRNAVTCANLSISPQQGIASMCSTCHFSPTHAILNWGQWSRFITLILSAGYFPLRGEFHKQLAKLALQPFGTCGDYIQVVMRPEMGRHFQQLGLDVLACDASTLCLKIFFFKRSELFYFLLGFILWKWVCCLFFLIFPYTLHPFPRTLLVCRGILFLELPQTVALWRLCLFIFILSYLKLVISDWK